MGINTYPSRRPDFGFILHGDGSVMSYKSSSSQVLRNITIEELQIKGITVIRRSLGLIGAITNQLVLITGARWLGYCARQPCL